MNGKSVRVIDHLIYERALVGALERIFPRLVSESNEPT